MKIHPYILFKGNIIITERHERLKDEKYLKRHLWIQKSHTPRHQEYGRKGYLIRCPLIVIL